jgi:hypothetical protein
MCVIESWLHYVSFPAVPVDSYPHISFCHCLLRWVAEITETGTFLGEQCFQLAEAPWVPKSTSLYVETILPTRKATSMHLVRKL